MTYWKLAMIGLLSLAGCEKPVVDSDRGGERRAMTASDKVDGGKVDGGKMDGGKTEAGKTTSASTTMPAETGAAIAGLDPNKPGETVMKTEEEWKKILTPEEYRVLREKGTERAFKGKYDEHFEKGAYECAACGLELFTSETKFNSGCGWPAFFAAKAGDRGEVDEGCYARDGADGSGTCSRCGSHLGHVFDDAPDKPTGQRFCINSVSLKFVPSTQPTSKKSE